MRIDLSLEPHWVGSVCAAQNCRFAEQLELFQRHAMLGTGEFLINLPRPVPVPVPVFCNGLQRLYSGITGTVKPLGARSAEPMQQG